jgi:hypothetical protein
MSRTKSIMLALLATLALSAAISTSASAYEYFVEGTEIGASEKVEIKGVSNKFSLETTIGKLPVLLICNDGTMKGDLEAGGDSTREYNLRSCYISENNKGKNEFLSACMVAEPITIKDRGEILVNHVENLFPEGLPNIELVGEKCVFKGKYAFWDWQVCAAPESEFNKVLHKDICSPVGAKPELEESPAYITNPWAFDAAGNKLIKQNGAPPPILVSTSQGVDTVCRFKLVGNRCGITFRNNSGENITIISVDIEGEDPATRYKKTVTGCTAGVLSTANSCSDEVQMEVKVMLSNNPYCMHYERASLPGMSSVFCAILKPVA